MLALALAAAAAPVLPPIALPPSLQRWVCIVQKGSPRMVVCFDRKGRRWIIA